MKPDEIRSEDIDKKVIVEGQITEVDNVQPLCTDAKFECPSCGNIINVLQMDVRFQQPRGCGCGRRGRFRLLEKKMKDYRVLFLEGLPVELTDDLVNHKYKEGQILTLLGIVKAKPYLYSRSNSRFHQFELQVSEVLNV